MEQEEKSGWHVEENEVSGRVMHLSYVQETNDLLGILIVESGFTSIKIGV